MKTNAIIVAVILIGLAAFVSEAGNGSSGTKSSGQTSSDNNNSGPVSSVPDDLTNLPIVGNPAIVDPNGLLASVGASNITDMVATSIGDMLSDSGYFTFTETNDYNCLCEIRLTDLQIKNLSSGGGVKGSLTNLLLSLTYVHCGISMRMVGLPSHHSMATGEGTVTHLGTLGSLIGAFGITTTNSNRITTSDISAALIERASDRAFSKMIPKLKTYLLKHQTGQY